MKIVFFSHPDFSEHKSMPRFTNMLARGMKERGHTIEILAPKSRFSKIQWLHNMKKWLGYIDQYVIFPVEVRRKLRKYSSDTLFVFIDHALGPWVPMVADRFHVIHCHDFLAQLSALGEISENSTGWSGRQYQAYIRRGFTKGKNFISISKNTQEDLHRFILPEASNSHIVYNGLNNSFEPFDPKGARLLFGNKVGLQLSAGYLLHVGGNQWYKNRLGVIEIYDAWRSGSQSAFPLIMIGENPSYELVKRHEQSKFKENIHFRSDIEDEFVRLAYAGASLFLFPSFAEGFGWPIIEAMACGSPVITTNKAPMTEVADNAGYFISRRPKEQEEVLHWAMQSAKAISSILALSDKEREAMVKAGLENAKRFTSETALNKIEKIYLKVLEA